MVVDDVEDDGQAARMGGVYEALQTVWAAVGLMGRPQVDTVVPPSVTAGEGRDGQQLHRVYAERHQMVEAVDSGVERPLRRERADVHLVEDAPRERTAVPMLVRQCEPSGVVDTAL